MRHVNIPVFIPHLGCPNDCVFCNQRIISGKIIFNADTVEHELESATATITPDDYAEIAFFGGSFTGIDRELMLRLLDTAQHYVHIGKVKSIRISTRPDYINDEILGILSHYSVKTIELGIQSLDDCVLSASRRGHTVECAVSACRMVTEAGFNLVGQMMLGLPGSDYEKEYRTALGIANSGAKAVRIYPTAVLAGTVLDDMMLDGRYNPLTADEAAKRCVGLIKLFNSRGIGVLRIGLCDSEELRNNCTGGVYHPAFGELVKTLIYRSLLDDAILQIAGIPDNNILIVSCPIGAMSAVFGYRRSNKEYLKNTYKISKLIIRESQHINEYNITVECTVDGKDCSISARL